MASPQKAVPSGSRKIKTRPPSAAHPLEILDLVYPETPEAEARLAKSTNHFHQRLSQQIWNLDKGAVSALYRSVLILAAACQMHSNATTDDTTTSTVNASANEEESEHKRVYQLFTSGAYRTAPLSELGRSALASSSVCIHKKDLPAIALDKDACFWMQQALKHLCDVDIALEDAEVIIRDGFGMRVISHLMPQAARHSFMRETYVVGGDNLTAADEAKKHNETFLTNAKRKWFDEDVDPFDGFNFSINPYALSGVARAPCPRCNKKNHLYCPECVTFSFPSEATDSQAAATEPVDPASQAPLSAAAVAATPLFSSLLAAKAHQYTYRDEPLTSLVGVPLPLSVDLVHHPQERISKSTGLHSCLLAPSQARLIEFPNEIPEYDPESTVILFPTEDAHDMWDPTLDFSKITKAVVIEATWQKAGSVIAHPNLANLKKVRLRERVSTFWRHQELGSQFLSTLEAIYYLCVEAHERQVHDGVSSPATALPIPAMYKDGALHPTNRPGLVESVAPVATGEALKDVETGNSNRAAIITRPVVPRTYEETAYKGQFDDLLLLYANRHNRVHKRYQNEDPSRIPKVWRSKQLTQVQEQETQPDNQ